MVSNLILLWCHVKRLLDVNMPRFGAILNGLTGGVGGYYYYKSYKNTYVTKAEEFNGTGVKITENGHKPRGRRE